MFSSNTTQVDGGYQISRSLRFNSADSAYLNRTVSTSNRQVFTFSFWVKRSALGLNHIYGANIDANNEFTIRFPTNDYLEVYDYQSAYNLQLITTQVFRDVSAWYHIVVAIDTTQATASNRAKIYVNGTQITAFGVSTYPSQNYNTLVNSSSTTYNRIGSMQTSSGFYNGYITETNFIDGQALTPSSFGETNAQTGVWQPKAYSGSYGTNGFYLNFSDNSNTTAATLGKDYSGNGNNWTPNNFSVTAGVGNDSLVDSPTPYGTTDTGVGGEIRGNYCTLNSTIEAFSGEATESISNGNLDFSVTGTSGNYAIGIATIPVTSGKWYCEFYVTAKGAGQTGIGFINANNLSAINPAGYGIAQPSDGWWRGSDGLFNNASKPVASLSTISSTDLVMMAVDFDSGKMWFGRNGTWENSGNPSAGTSPMATFTASGKSWVFATQAWTTSTASNGSFNFGQRPFAYTAPSGFKALCTQNLPTPTIGATTATQANKYFNVVLRNGAGSAGGTFSTTVNMANGALLWDKTRNLGGDNLLTDSVRGISKYLVSNSSGAEGTDVNYVTAFGTNSYTVGSSDWPTDRTVVDWMWAANGSGSTNTSGSITSTVSANTTSGFSVVTYTGAGGTATVGHGLGVAPSMVVVKRRNAVSDWFVYHTSIGATKGLFLNNTYDAVTSANLWNNTAPTSTVFSIGTDATVNTGTYVAYCFSEVQGFSKFGSYVGNGSADGPFVFCGFRPAYVMIKASSGTPTGNWVIQDDTRNPFNVSNNNLYANLSNAEDTSFSIDFLSNGFKLRSSAYDATNQSGASYVFMAFAEVPTKFSLAR